MQKETGLLERVFHLSENGTSVKTEIMAGITTFMTMAYILAVNPAIMSAAGMDKGAVLTATAIAGFLGTVLMAAFSNYPFALAPGMGLNAFFAFTVVKQMGYTWEWHWLPFSSRVSSSSCSLSRMSVKRSSMRSRSI